MKAISSHRILFTSNVIKMKEDSLNAVYLSSTLLLRDRHRHRVRDLCCGVDHVRRLPSPIL